MWGRILGTLLGFAFGRVIGAALGFYVGYLFDRKVRKDFERVGGFTGFFRDSQKLNRQAIFFHSVFSVMGHVAKSNGRVTKEHIQIAELLMDELGLTSQQRREAQNAYREGKDVVFGLKDTLEEFKRSVYNRRDILQVFLELQIQCACADGIVTNNERDLLSVMATTLGFSPRELDKLLQRWEAEYRFQHSSGSNSSQRNRQSNGSSQQRQRRQPASAPKGPTLEDAYQIIGVPASASDAEVKKAYRKLMQQHHPDKLISKGLPEEMMKKANQKVQDIKAAYDLIQEKRK